MLQREEGVAGMEEDIMAGKVAVEAVRCYHCDEVEHISRDCPNPRRPQCVRTTSHATEDCPDLLDKW